MARADLREPFAVRERGGEIFPRVGCLEIAVRAAAVGIRRKTCALTTSLARIGNEWFRESNQPGEWENSAGRGYQVTLAGPISVIRHFIADEAAQEALIPGYEQELIGEVRSIAAAVRTTSSPCSGMWRPLSSSGWSEASPPVSAERGIR